MKNGNGTLSEREYALFKFVRAFIEEQHYPPSQRQMMVALGYKAVKSVQQLISQLERKGYLAHAKGLSRSLKVTAPHNGRDAA